MNAHLERVREVVAHAAGLVHRAVTNPVRYDEDCVVARPHDGDCQAAQHTYVTSADVEAGVSTHCGAKKRFFAADVVGANGRRLLVRDDPDGVYVGGCLITDMHDLDDLIGVLTEFRNRREVS